MASKTTEIRAKLRVEDGGGAATLERLKAGFMGADRAARSATGGMLGFAKQAAAMATGITLGGMASEAVMATKAWAMGAPAAANLTRQLTAMNAVLGGSSIRQAGVDARATVEEFRAIGEESGQSLENLKDGFKVLLETSSGSATEMARAKVELGQLGELADVLDMNVASASREVGLLHEGILRTKGPMFQLLMRTGIFGKDVHGAAEAWGELTNDERAKRVAYGLAKVAGDVGKLPATWGRVTGQMSALFEGLRLDFGEPLLDAMIPALQGLLGLIGASKGDIRSFARTMGTDVGRWVTEAVTKVEEGFKYLKDHQEEIRKAIGEGVDKAKALVEFVLAHKEALAAAFGAKAVLPALGAGANAAGALVKASAASGGVAGELGAAGGGLAAAGAAVTFAAFAAAVAAWALAIDQWKKLMDMTEGGKSAKEQDTGARGTALKTIVAGATGRENLDMVRDIGAKYVAGFSGDAAKVAEATELVRQAMDSATSAQQAYLAATAAAAMQDEAAAEQRAGDVTGAAATLTLASSKLEGAFDFAVKSHNQGLQEQIAAVVLGSKGLQDALVLGGMLTAEGFESLAHIVEGSSKSFADDLRQRAADNAGRMDAAKAPAPTINMSGGQTFKVQQDFRDQDPDRVAVVFEEGIGRMVSQRIGSNTSTPFGT